MEKLKKTDAEWRAGADGGASTTSPRAGHRARRSRARYWDNKDDGMYRCNGCGSELFSSDTKFDSGTGWPSFLTRGADAVETAARQQPVHEAHEVVCSRCGGHLGHVFDDGPSPTGQRYCINSCSLDLDTDQAGRANGDGRVHRSRAARQRPGVPLVVAIGRWTAPAVPPWPGGGRIRAWRSGFRRGIPGPLLFQGCRGRSVAQTASRSSAADGDLALVEAERLPALDLAVEAAAPARS